MTDEKSDLKHVYLIYSAHSLLLKEALRRLIAQVSKNGSEVLDTVRFNSADHGIDEIMASLGTISFFGGRRLVIIDDIFVFKRADQDRLLDYINNPNPQTILVIAVISNDNETARKLKSHKIFKACSSSSSAMVHEYTLKKGLSSWVKADFKSHGKSVTNEAVLYLITWVGNDLNRLKNEITKACDNAGPDEQEIDGALVKQVVVTTNEAEVFDLIGAVIDQDAELALTLTSALLDKDSSQGRVFGLLERQFQLLLDVMTKGKGLRGQGLAKALGVSSGQAYYLEKQIRLFSLPRLRRALKLLVDADYVRKSSSISPKILLERLVFDLCNI